jgi:hypothetical protein
MTRLTYLERLAHGDSRECWRPLWELSDELVEELLGPNLELERVAAVLDKRVQQLTGIERRSARDAAV